MLMETFYPEEKDKFTEVFDQREWSAPYMVDPEAIRNRLESFHLEGRTIQSFHSVGGSLFHEEDDFDFSPDAVHYREMVLDEPFLIRFEDGDVFEILCGMMPEFQMSMNCIPWEIEPYVRAVNADAKILFSPLLGKQIRNVEVETYRTDRDPVDHDWIDEGHRQWELAGAVSLWFTDGTKLIFSHVMIDSTQVLAMDEENKEMVISLEELKEGLDIFKQYRKLEGKRIANIIPQEADYALQANEYFSDWIECRIHTASSLNLIFDDATSLYFCLYPGGPGVDVIVRDEIVLKAPEGENAVPLPSLFRYSIGYEVLSAERTDESFVLYLKGGTRLRVKGAGEKLVLTHTDNSLSPLYINREDLEPVKPTPVPTEKEREEESWFRFSTVEEDTETMDEEFGNFGFQNKDGETVIEPQFLSCGYEFRAGRCPVALNRNWYRTPEGRRYYQMFWGYIDKFGKMVIPPRFRAAKEFTKYGVAAVLDEYTRWYYLIDTEGRPLPGLEGCAFSEFYEPDDRFLEFSFGDGNNMNCNNGLYDARERKILVPPEKLGFSVWKENLIEVTDMDAAGEFTYYIDSEGKDLFPEFTKAHLKAFYYPSESGYVTVFTNEYLPRDPEDDSGGYFIRDGKRFDRIQKHGIADIHGNIMIPLEYDNIYYGSLTDLFYCQKGEEKTTLRIHPNGTIEYDVAERVASKQ